MVEDLLAARGIVVSHQTVRCLAETFGRTRASKIRRRSDRNGAHDRQWYRTATAVAPGPHAKRIIFRRVPGVSGWALYDCGLVRSLR